MAAYLRKEGMSFTEANPADFGFITDNNFQNADVPDESLNSIAAKVIASKELLVFPGFIGITSEGRRTTLGRGCSDYTAAVLGAALKRNVEIWTDVDGICRIAPCYLPIRFKKAGHPETIKELSYEEAFQMASFGSRVLHQKTLDAVRQAARKGKHIHLYIKNTFNPDNAGTVISGKRTEGGSPVGITCLEGTQLLNIYPKSIKDSIKIFTAIHRLEKHIPVLPSQTWGRISLVYDSYFPLLSQWESQLESHFSRDQALIKIVGDGIGDNPKVLSQIQGALYSAENPDKYGMTLVHKTPRLITDNSYEFLVKKRGLNEILTELYKALFMSDIASVGLLGMGTVGSGLFNMPVNSTAEKNQDLSLLFLLSWYGIPLSKEKNLLMELSPTMWKKC